MNRAFCVVIPALLCVGRSSIDTARPAPVTWAIDSKPVFDVGAESEDTLETFGRVMGTARLSNGQVVIADYKSFSLRYFAPNGRYIKSVGRRGDGPGEFSEGVLRMMHCGDSLYAMNWNQTTLVFSADGHFKRDMRLVPPRPGESAYTITCNAAGLMLSFGWERHEDSKPGTFRPLVPFWIANPDGSIHAQLAPHSGSERFGDMHDGRLGGSGPLPLGKQSVVAIGRARAYIGTADSFAIEVYSLDGKPIGTIRQPGINLRTTQADIEHFLALDTAGQSEASKASTIKRYKQSVTYPSTIPAYSAMLVDSDDDLWVERFPRPADTRAQWLVFSSNGSQLARIDLPLNLHVHEIGRDYILGVSTELPDGVHHVKEYRLHRGS